MNDFQPPQHEELSRTIEPEIIKMKPVQRIIALFTAPKELMKNIKAYPVILVPFLVALIFGLITVIFGGAVFEMRMQEQSNVFIERHPGVTNPFDFESLFATEYNDIPMPDIRGMGIASLFTGAFINPFLVSFVVTLAVFVLAKIMRGRATFGQTFSMCMHMYIIYALGILVVAGLMAATESLLDVTSLAAVLYPQADFTSLSYGVLSYIAVFPIWTTAIVFIGAKSLNDFSNAKAGIIAGFVFLGGMAYHILSLMGVFIMYDLMIGWGMWQ
jgi:hypothetical protein